MPQDINSSGSVSLGGSTAGESVNLTLGSSATAQRSMNDADVRKLAATTVSSPANAVLTSGNPISFSSFYGRAGYSTIDFSPSYIGGTTQKYIGGRITDGVTTTNFGNYSDAISGYTNGSFTFSYDTAAGRGLAVTISIVAGFAAANGLSTDYVKAQISGGDGVYQDITQTQYLQQTGSGTNPSTGSVLGTTQRVMQTSQITSGNGTQTQFTFGFTNSAGGIPNSFIGRTLTIEYENGTPTGNKYTYIINLT